MTLPPILAAPMVASTASPAVPTTADAATSATAMTAQPDSCTINTAATNGTAGFANDTAGGVFSLAVAGNDLNLKFTPGGQQ